jgi:inorganic pyrophosphatase
MSTNLLHDISPGNDVPNDITVVIEINKGSLNKYELDKATGLIKLDRVSHTAQTFPFDYGFVPQTHWHDGDPLDVVVIATAPLMPGVLVDVRPVGVMDMIDSGESDAKILAVPIGDPRFGHVQDLSDVNPHFIKEVTHFYENYKKLQNKVVTIPTIRDANAAKEVILEGIELYKKKFNK